MTSLLAALASTLTDPHALSVLGTSFFACLVECVEALTIVLAVGMVHGWRPALGATAAALALLAVLILALGPAFERIPLRALHLAVGIVLFTLGVSWWRKAVRRLAGVLPHRDETRAFARVQQAEQASLGARRAGNWGAASTAFKGVTVEGIEVVIIVIGMGSGGARLTAGVLGAVAAILSVVILGVLLRAPLARIPQTVLKLAVGSVCIGFGLFWMGSGAGIPWPGDDWALVVLVAAALGLALLLGRVPQLPPRRRLFRGPVDPAPATRRVPLWALMLSAWILAALAGLPMLLAAPWQGPLLAAGCAALLAASLG
jgi:uncharacterized membrane protein